MVEQTPIERPAAEHGWLRRSDLDTISYDAWEMPDGKLYASEKGVTPKLVTFSPGLTFRDVTGMTVKEKAHDRYHLP